MTRLRTRSTRPKLRVSSQRSQVIQMRRRLLLEHKKNRTRLRVTSVRGASLALDPMRGFAVARCGSANGLDNKPSAMCSSLKTDSIECNALPTDVLVLKKVLHDFARSRTVVRKIQRFPLLLNGVGSLRWTLWPQITSIVSLQSVAQSESKRTAILCPPP